MWFYSDGSNNDKFTCIFDVVFVSESSLHHFDNAALNVVRKLKSQNEKPRRRSSLQALINEDGVNHPVRRNNMGMLHEFRGDHPFVVENGAVDAMEADDTVEELLDDIEEEGDELNVREAEHVAYNPNGALDFVWNVVHRDDTITMTADNARLYNPTAIYDGLLGTNN